MSSVRWLLVVPALLLGAVEVKAQAFGWPSPYSVGGVAFSARGKHFSLSLNNGYGAGYYPAYPSLYGPTLGPLVPGYPVPVSRVTVIYGYTPPPAPPPVVLILPAPRHLDEDDSPPELLPRRPPPPDPLRGDPPGDERPLPGEAAGGFRPIKPVDRDRAQRPIPPEAPPRPEPPAAKPPERMPADLPLPKPHADPREEHARQLVLGKEAFANQAYGRAAQHFGRATALRADEPLGHFLFAQALFVLGKYADAVEAIHTGLRLQPAWPTMTFRPLELYGANVKDHAQHLTALEQAVGLHPRDPVLLFLYAYQLWFDGRKDEAGRLFQRAAAVTADRGDIDRFLQAMPGAPVI